MPLHERCSLLQRACLPPSSAAPFLVNSSFPGPPRAQEQRGQGGLLAAGRAQGRPRPTQQPGLLQGQAGGLSRPRSSFSAPAGSRKAGDPLCFLRNLFSSQAIKQVSSDTQHSQSKGTEMGPGEPRPASPASRDPREGRLTPLPQAHAGQSPSG